MIPNCAREKYSDSWLLWIRQSRVYRRAADLKCEDLTDIKNHELVYNDTIDRSVADDPLNYLTGHPLDTKKNHTLVWYGCPKLGNTGVASVIVKAFNGKRSDEASKKIRPIIGMFNSESHRVSGFHFCLNFSFLHCRFDVV